MEAIQQKVLISKENKIKAKKYEKIFLKISIQNYQSDNENNISTICCFYKTYKDMSLNVLGIIQNMHEREID